MIKYKETLTFNPIVNVVYVALVATLIWAAWNEPGPLLLLILVSVTLFIIPVFFGRLLIWVDDQTLHVAFGLFKWPSQHIPLDSIRESRVVEYKPLINFGGWGCRRGRFEGELTSVYSLRGKRGVLLDLKKERRICTIKTTRFLIGSREPERLFAALGA